MDWSLPGSSVHGIPQARILEWVAMPSSRGSTWPRDQARPPTLPADFLLSEPREVVRVKCFNSIWLRYATSLQLCPTMCDPRDGRPPGPAIPRILQARKLEWLAISFSNAWKWKVKGKSLNHVQLLAMDGSLPGSSVHGIFQARVLEWVVIFKANKWNAA